MATSADLPKQFLDDPFHIGGTGAPALTGADDHLRDQILAVLFTNPGERVNLPEFGAGIRNLVFAGNNEVLRATTQFVVTQHLQRWLGDEINIAQVVVANEEETLRIEIIYTERRTLQRRRLSLQV